MLYNKANQNSGFTLFEISVSLLVASTLVGLAILGLKDTKKDTQNKKKDATLTAVEYAKTRYILDNNQNVIGQPTVFDQIAPYLERTGEKVGSLFDLVEGTGKPSDDLDLGNYNTLPAHFNSDQGDEPITTSTSPPFDVNDPEAALAAIGQLAGLDPDDPLYQEILDGLNEAVILGTIDPSDLSDAGLVNYNDTWMNAEVAQELAALDAHNSLTSGGNWADLTEQQKEAYANLFPAESVAAGGSDALNLMNPSILTPELVDGYGNVGGTWKTPETYVAPTNLQTNAGNVFQNSANPFAYYRDHYGWTNDNITHLTTEVNWNYNNAKQWWQQDGYTIYVATNPVGPAVAIGTVAPTVINSTDLTNTSGWYMTALGTQVGTITNTGFPIWDHGMVSYNGQTTINQVPITTNTTIPWGYGIPVRVPTDSKVFLIKNKNMGYVNGKITYQDL